jgi:maltooligosyltrehalose trehalohydrolase
MVNASACVRAEGASRARRDPQSAYASDFVGARLLGESRCTFRVWAPRASRARLEFTAGCPAAEMHRSAHGYFEIVAPARAGAQYRFALDAKAALPDPASRFQPAGALGPSEVVDLGAFEFTDAGWLGVELRHMIIYELHIGAFTADGTLDSAIPKLDSLKELGVTAVELMPVSQFSGTRNWGYDGVFPFAVQNSYGGPYALQRFVDAAHARGLAVILDVVYNHLGPEGNVFPQFGPCFTDRHRTPWGEAINFDGAESDPVREFFIDNALFWLRDFHIDALRLDAVHGIFDLSARHFLAELQERVSALEIELGRKLHLIAESDLNDARILRAPAFGGYGLSAQWSDDFHHALHVLLTGERGGYYEDFNGVSDLAVAIRNGWRYAGDYSRSRRRRHGNSPEGVAAEQFVVCAQNHDQIGNRASGDRLTSTLSFDKLKLAAAANLLSPFVPLLFMGEEYAERAPFPYFTSHSDPALAEAVRRGRREEFASFGSANDVPDPQAESTFESAKLNMSLASQQPGATMLRFYTELIRLRKELPIAGCWPTVVEDADAKTPKLAYSAENEFSVFVAFNFGETASSVDLGANSGSWRVTLDSSASDWAETPVPCSLAASVISDSTLSVPPHSVLLLTKEKTTKQEPGK